MKASVIIPAFNAQKTIRMCLESLQQQTIPGKDYEILVVDDGSTDTTAAIASQFKGVILLRQENAGPARARNQGAKKATGEIVVFLDADCVPKKDWLEKMLEPFQDLQVVGVQGRYENPLGRWVARFVQFEIEERYCRMEKSMARTGGIDFVGSYSAAYRKSVFLDAHGFDEGFRRASGEDPDLSYRLAANKQGCRLVFAPGATVSHFHPTSLLKYWRTKFYRAFWRVRMYKKNPEKIKGDSYTPKAFKFQMLALAIAVFFGIVDLAGLFFLSHSFWWPLFLPTLCFFVLVPLLTLPQSFFIFRKDAALGLFSVFVFWANALLFSTGFAWGFAKGVQQ